MAHAANSRMLISSTTSSLTHLRTLTCASSSSSTRLFTHPPDLIRWIRKEGGFVHPALRIAHHDTYGLGVNSTQQIPQGSDLISLPSRLQLRFHSDEDDDGPDPLLDQLAQRVPEELWAMRLGLKLLKERAKVGSFWWPYICNLPETYSIPIFFPGEDIKNLQYAPLLHQVNKRCRFLLELEKDACRLLGNGRAEDHPFGGQAVEASSLGWAMSAVSSRAFRSHGEKLSDGTHIPVPMMLPLIDMCNHCFNSNAEIVQGNFIKSPEQSVKVVAKTQIGRDDPVVLNYGCFSNDFFLLDYGFVISTNPYDTIELKYDGALLDAASMTAGIASPNFSSPFPWQQEILVQLGLHGEAASLKVTLGGTELVDGRLLAATRVLHAADEEMVKKLDLSTLKSLSAEAPLGISNEIAVMRTIIALCVIALGHFPTKLMEDEEVLKGAKSSPTKLSAQFRIEKKSLIINVMQSLTRRVKAVSSKVTQAFQG